MAVDVPEEARGGAAVRAPGLGDLDQRRAARARVQALDPLDRDLHRQVVGRPDVGTAEREQQVDLGAPQPDPLGLNQALDRRRVVQPAEPVEIDAAGHPVRMKDFQSVVFFANPHELDWLPGH